MSMQKEWKGEVTVPSSWNVTSLEMASEDFPLERTNREINDCDAGQVADRISDALRKLSIKAEYDGPNAKAKCQTQDLVSFRIRLYSGGVTGQPIIVEVQRRSGSTRSFMQSCRAILAAAEGQSVDTNHNQAKNHTRTVPPFLKSRPVGDLKCLQGANVPDVETSTNGALQRVVELLGATKMDVQVLGLENLACLTDPIQSAPKCALMAAKAVFLPTEQVCVREDVCTVLARCNEDDDSEDDEARGVNLREKSRHFCMLVFSTSLSVMAQSGCLKECVESEQTWFVETLLPLLLGEVSDAATGPNNAYLAVSGLKLLLCGVPRVTDKVSELDGPAILRNANEVGRQVHELLEKEAGKCLDRYESFL